MAPSNDGRTVFLTGANGGIGRHMLTALVDDGYRVTALDVDGDNVCPVRDRAPEQVQFYECDVTDDGGVAAAVNDVIDRWGRIDVLVNNAAEATVASFEDQSDAAIRRTFEVNYFGYLRTIRAVLPHMRARGEGIVHNVGSGTGDLGHPGLTGYAATKGAIKALTRSLRLELRGTGVSCTLMIPPTTDTRLSAEFEYPGWMTVGPAEVGRKLADRVESTAPVITPDWRTSLGLALFERFPRLWAAVTDRYVDVLE